jgi:hypothetical protein
MGPNAQGVGEVVTTGPGGIEIVVAASRGIRLGFVRSSSGHWRRQR